MPSLIDKSGKIAYYGQVSWGNLVDWLATIYDFRWRALLTYSAWTAAGATLLAWAFAAWQHTRGIDRAAAEHEARREDIPATRSR